MPLDIKVAKEHGLTNTVCRSEDGEKFPIFTGLKDLGEFGTGLPLYFHFQKKCMGLLLFVSVLFFWTQLQTIVLQVFSTSVLNAGNEPGEWPGSAWIGVGARQRLNYTTKFSCVTAFASATVEDGPLDVTNIIIICLLYASLLAAAFLFAWLPFAQERLSEEIDNMTTSIDDFTVWIHGFPTTANFDERDLLEYLSSVDLEGRPNIIRITFAFDLGHVWRQLIAGMERIEQLSRFEDIVIDMNAVQSGELRSGSCCPSRLAVSRRAQAQQAISKLQQTSVDTKAEVCAKLKDLKVIGAFVTFETQSDAKRVSRVLQGAFWRCRFPKFHGVHLRARRAGNPSDIYWQNLGCSNAERVARRALSTLCSLILIIVSFTIISLLANYDFERVLYDGGGWLGSYQRNAWEALCVVIVNFLLYTCLGSLASFGRWSSFTRQQSASISQSTFPVVCNSVLVVIIAHWMADPSFSSGEVDWYATGSLVSELVTLVVSNAIISPLFFLVDLWHIMVRIPSRWMINPLTSSKTQAELNGLYLGPTFSLAGRFADSTKTVFMSFVLAPIIPLAPLFGFVGLALQHIVDRYFLFRLARRPEFYDKRVMTSTARIPAYLLALTPLSAFVLIRTPKHVTVEYFVSCSVDAVSMWRGVDHVLVSVGAIISVLLILIAASGSLLVAPRWILRRCCSRAQARTGQASPILDPALPTETRFQDVQGQFPGHYHKANPVYRILEESSNPALVSSETIEQVVGVPGGRKISEFLNDDTFLSDLFACLVGDVDNMRVMQTGVSNAMGGTLSLRPSSP